MKKYEYDQAVEDIVELFEKRVLLGAAWDCMSEEGKLSFKAEVLKILNDRDLSFGPS